MTEKEILKELSQLPITELIKLLGQRKRLTKEFQELRSRASKRSRIVTHW